MKLIFSILLFFLFPILIFASEEQLYKKEYRFFKEVKQGEYEEYTKKNTKYEYTDEEDFYYETIDKWQWTCEENEIDKVEYGIVTPIQKITPIHYIKIINQGDIFDYSLFKIIKDDQEITYEVESCSLCENNYLQENGEILLFIEEGFFLDEVDFLSEPASYQIEFNNQKLWNRVIAIKKIENQSKFKIERPDIKTIKYTDFIYIEGDYRYNGFDLLYAMKEMCKITKKYVYRYNIVKEYADGYHENLEGYQKDEMQYKITYLDINEELLQENENKEESEKENIVILKQEPEILKSPEKVVYKNEHYQKEKTNNIYPKVHFYIYITLIFFIIIFDTILLKNMSKKER